MKSWMLALPLCLSLASVAHAQNPQAVQDSARRNANLAEWLKSEEAKRKAPDVRLRQWYEEHGKGCATFECQLIDIQGRTRALELSHDHK